MPKKNILFFGLMAFSPWVFYTPFPIIFKYDFNAIYLMLNENLV